MVHDVQCLCRIFDSPLTDAEPRIFVCDPARAEALRPADEKAGARVLTLDAAGQGSLTEAAEGAAEAPEVAELRRSLGAQLSDAQAPPSVSCRPQVSATMVSIGRRSLLISTEPVVR